MSGLANDTTVVYAKEAVGIAIYNDNRQPDGNPDEVRELAPRYTKVTRRWNEQTSSYDQTTEQVTDEREIFEIERRMRANERDDTTEVV